MVIGPLLFMIVSLIIDDGVEAGMREILSVFQDKVSYSFAMFYETDDEVIRLFLIVPVYHFVQAIR